MNRVIRFFRDVHMGLAHDGLFEIAKEHGIDCKKLRVGEFVIFANRKQNRLKVYAPNNVIAYYRHPEDKRFDLNIVRHVPNCFNGKSFDFAKAVEKAVLEALQEKE